MGIETMNRTWGLFWIMVGLLSLSACSRVTGVVPSPTAGSPLAGIAEVQRLELLQRLGDPSQIMVAARLALPDACTSVDTVDVSQAGQGFEVAITTLRQAGDACSLNPLVIDRLIPLEVANLPAGTYTVTVNGVGASFDLATEVAQAAQPTLEPAPTEVATEESATPEASEGETQPSLTPTAPTSEPTPTELPPKDCEDIAAFYGDLSVPDGTIFRQGETFTKTWKLRNEGTCTWGPGYALVFSEGDVLNAPLSVPLPGAIPPGEIVEVSVDMTAPPKGGPYYSDWLLQDDRGTRFGTGAARKVPVWVKINVGYIDPSGETGEENATPPKTGCGEQANAGYESEMLDLINAHRAKNGLPKLKLDDQLTAAARKHSADMACNAYTGHIGLDGSNWNDRVAAQGYDYVYVVENIYYGGGAGDAVRWWVSDRPHEENLLDPGATEIGIGHAYLRGSPYGDYFTVDIAKP
jgi:uncharacterized protein YkwD